MKLKRLFIFLLIYLLVVPQGSIGEIKQCAELDAAFMFLERGNIFLRRYNKITNQNIVPHFELGTPYFFGGQNEKHSLQTLPKYTKRRAWQDSIYYRKGTLYLEGFDCMGFIKCIHEHAKKEIPQSIGFIINHWYENKDKYIISHRDKEIPDFKDWHKILNVGDLLATRKNLKGHIMMYIGTLEDYGFTADEVPLLKDYLKYPLVIHSTSNPQHSIRFERLIKETPEYKNCTVSDGGICISLLGVPLEKASNRMNRFNVDYNYFWIDNYSYMLTLHDWSHVQYFAWFKMPYKKKP